MQINHIIIAGNLTKDPELRETPNGVSVSNLRIAANRGGKDNSEVLFMDVTAWKKTAEVVCEYCRKGDELVVEGRISQDEWVDKDGNKRVKHEIIAHNIQFKLPTMGEGSETVGSTSGASRDEVPF
jgi:single-strand DNA-binding protein